jgi:hypothetical protein
MTTAQRQKCPYCGAKVRLVDSAELYAGVSYGYALACERFPDCDAYVGCHRGTTEPLGTLADAKLRQARRAAHAAFDPIWKRGLMARAEAYWWLGRRLGLSESETHVALFDVGQCLAVVEVCAEYLANRGFKNVPGGVPCESSLTEPRS